MLWAFIQSWIQKVLLKRNTAPEQVQSFCYIPYVLHFNSGHVQPKHSKMNRNKAKIKKNQIIRRFFSLIRNDYTGAMSKYVFFHGAHPNIEQNIGFHHHHCSLRRKKTWSSECDNFGPALDLLETGWFHRGSQLPGHLNESPTWRIHSPPQCT